MQLRTEETFKTLTEIILVKVKAEINREGVLSDYNYKASVTSVSVGYEHTNVLIAISGGRTRHPAAIKADATVTIKFSTKTLIAIDAWNNFGNNAIEVAEMIGLVNRIKNGALRNSPGLLELELHEKNLCHDICNLKRICDFSTKSINNYKGSDHYFQENKEDASST